MQAIISLNKCISLRKVQIVCIRECKRILVIIFGKEKKTESIKMQTLCNKDFSSTEEVMRMNPLCSQAFHFGRKKIYFFQVFKNFLRTEQNCRRHSLSRNLFSLKFPLKIFCLQHHLFPDAPI